MQSVSGKARDHVKMKMKHELACGTEIILSKIYTICTCAFLDRLRDAFCELDRLSEDIIRSVKKRFMMRFRHDECMPVIDWVDVEERHRLVVLVDFRARDLPYDDFTKYAVSQFLTRQSSAYQKCL